VAAVGASSITYQFEMRCEGEVAVRGKAVAALLTKAGGLPIPWPEGSRRLLLAAGPQAPERLVIG
jgi:acyl-CoA thioesterase FadM